MFFSYILLVYEYIVHTYWQTLYRYCRYDDSTIYSKLLLPPALSQSIQEG
jgi:hypothetical protein